MPILYDIPLITKTMGYPGDHAFSSAFLLGSMAAGPLSFFASG